MKKFKLLARLLLVMCLIPWPAKAQTRKIVCDVDCGTDPNSTGFSGIVAARASIPNQRGGGHPLAVMPRMPILVRNVEGSQSYDYSVNLLSLTGRNGSNLNLSLSYNSRVWTRGTTGISLNADLDNPSYGFRGVDFGFIQANSTSSDYILTRKNGSKSELFLVSGNLYQSHDSTYVQFDATTNVWKLTAKDGTQTFYTPFGDGTILRPITIENSNGNKISIAYVNTSNLAISTITDTLGRVVTFTYDAAGKLTTISQGSKTVTFNWNTAYLLAYNFSLPIVGSAANGSTQTVLSGVTFADHTSVNFFYGDWAIVNRIERRSASGALRASVSYNFPAAVSGALNDAPAFTQQTMFDGVNTGVWNYASATNASGLVTSFAVTDPSGTKTTSTFSSNGDWRDGLQLTEQTKDATGKQWRLKVRTWTADNLTTGANPHPSLITAQVDDGTQSQVAFAYDANGNITDVKEYDFGPAGPGALLRETVTSYASLGSNIMDRPSQVLIKDGAGNIVARTDFNYDQYASVPLKGVTPAAAQHDDVNYSTSPTASRGNLTTKTVYTNAAAGSGAITSTFTYDVLGNRVLAVDGCCTQASSSYSAATQYAFPDSVSIGPSGNQLTASFAYNFNTGTVATATDANGQLTTFTYDLNDRVASVHTPDNVTTSTNFDDSSANPGWSSSNTANSEVTAVTTDFAGHALSQQVRNGLSLIGTITSGRDVLGRLVQKTNPYGPGDAAAYTTFGYDAIGREIQSTPPALVSGVTQASFQTAFSGHTAVHSDPAGKQRKEYYNALGQLVQVDEPGDPFTGAFASGTLTIGGTLASQSGVGSTPAVKAAGNVNITGASSAPITICNPDITPRVGHPCSTITVSDRGTVTITVNGHSTSASYGASMSSTTIAGRLASAINLDTAAFVTASSSGSTLSLQSIAAGPSSNYGWNISSQSTDPTGTFGPGPGPFSASPASGTLAGGAAGNPGTTVPDKGTVTLSVGGLAATANYGSDPGLDNSAAAVAADLVTKIKAQLSPTNPAFAISVPQNGTQISFNWSSVGAAGNVSVSVVSTTTQTLFAFPAPSFTACASSGNPISCPSALVGGQDPAPSSLANPYTTQYAYSALGQLTQVTQGQQVRRFGYDSLGRLTSQSMPEKGNLSDTFTYTDFGGIAIRTDARGITATYSYDLLNRVSKIVYSDGTPTVTYAYGATGAANFAAGRLVTATDGAGSETYQYDMLGRVVKCTRVIGVNTYITSYAYTPDGRLSSTTYPSGRIVSNQYDPIGRLTQVSTGGAAVLNINSYNASGQILGMTYGNSTPAAYSYNAQLQIASILYGSSTSPLFSLAYNWGGANDDGLLMGVTDANSARSTSYTYDQLKRLTLAQTVDQVSANTWKLGFAYDRYGNRMSESILGGTAAMPSNLVLIDPATNHVISASYSYDADGDMTSDGLHTYSYDGEHRLNHVDGAANTYAYDGGGLRVNRNGNFYIYSAGKVIAEYAGGAVAASPTTEYVYARNKRVATINAGATTFHYWDHASIRSSANAAGSVVRTFGHFPFGEVWYETGAADKWKFTTYERDAESGLDYASARFHSSRLGRFMSLDPLPGDRKNPQSLNRYSYVRNNPISSSDPAGMEDCDDCDDSGGGGTPVYLQNECSMAMSCDGLGSGGQGGDSQGGDNQGNGDGGGSDQSQGPACDDSGNCQMPSSGDQGSSTPDYPWGPDSGDDSNTDSSNNNSDASAGPQCDENGDCTLPAQNKGPDVVDQAKQVNTVATWGMMVPGALLAAASIACAATPACALGAGAALISTLGVSGATLGFSGLVINALFGGTGAYSVVPSTSGCQVDICTGISSGAGAPPK